MTTETLREAVARAIFEKEGYCSGEDDDPFRRLTWEEAAADDYPVLAAKAREMADAAIRTVLERLRDADQMAAETAALVALAEHNVYTDVQEHIVAGDGRGRVAPGGLRKAVRAAKLAMLDAAAREVG